MATILCLLLNNSNVDICKQYSDNLKLWNTMVTIWTVKKVHIWYHHGNANS